MQAPESLVKAMAGPSSGKAGLALDQTEINRIIAEASKNSKFFMEAKRKDAQLTERIKNLIAHRDELMNMVDIAQADASVDHIISELELTRDLSRVICHVDLDAFFASVESLDNPSLVGKPFGVSEGVLTTANYEARKYGCRSGMATFIAKKLCPHLIVVPSRFHRYAEKSKEVMSVLEKYDPDMCVMGADEAFLTLNDYCDTHNLTAEECVEQMRAEVFRETKLTCSAGIAANRMLAKICSDRNKPNGQFSLPRDSRTIIEFMHDLPIRKIPGIGRVSERILTETGVKTCGDVYTHRAMISAMDKQLGLRGLLKAYLGLSSNVVQPPARELRKSVGVETTFTTLSDKDKLLGKLEKVASDLEEDLARTGWAGRTITLKYKLDNFQTFTRSKTLPRYITTKEDILAAGKDLFLRELPLKLRLIGLRLTTLKDLRSHAGRIEQFFGKGNEPQAQKHMIQDSEDEDANSMIDHSLRSDAEMTDHEDDGVQWDTEIPRMPARWGNVSPGTSPSKRGSWDVPQPEASTSAETPRSPAPVTPASRTSRLSESPSRPRKRRKADLSESSDSPARVANETTSNVGAMQHTPCPICGKELYVDNAGLNSHVDYCLSRGTIRTVQAAAAHDVDHMDGHHHAQRREKGVSGNDRSMDKSGQRARRLYDFGSSRRRGS